MKKKDLNKSFVKQLDQSDCGVACLASIIQFYGGRKSLESLRELSGTLQSGTTMLGLYQAAQKIGFNPEGFEADLDYLKKQKFPSVIHVVTNENIQHYMVCYGWENDHFIIGDPAHGIIQYNKNDLNSIWKSKVLLLLKPTDNIKKANSIRQDKRNWFVELIKDDISKLTSVFALSIIISLLGLVMAIFSQILIDDILPERNSLHLILGLLFVALLLGLKGGLGYISGLQGIRQGRDFNKRIVNRFYGNLLYLPKSFFDNRRIGELVARLDDTSQIQRTIATIVGELLNDALLFIVGEIILFTYSIQIGLFSLVALPVFIGISFLYHKKVVNAQHEVMVANAYKSSNYVNTMQGVATIKTNNREEEFGEQNRNIYAQFQDKIFNLGQVGISLQLVAEFAAVVIIIGIVSFSAYLVYLGSLTTGGLIAILTISGIIFPAITNLAFSNITLQGAKIAFDRMYEFSSIKPEYEISHKDDSDFEFEKMEVRNVSFRFPGRKLLLKNAGFKIKRGELVALFGESGGGKTTLMSILQRFYEPEDGLINVNDRNFYDIPVPAWRKKVGVIPQGINIFNGSLVENICFGKSEEEFEQCIQFCNENGFGKYFNEFPQGYATLLGEQGINISGGQKQLLALARVLYLKPQLLLLDEPTSAMDRNTENFAIKLLHEYKKEAAIMVVTHRVKIARHADNIYILSDGVIKINGNHKELLRTDNLYSLSYKEIV